MTIDDLEALEPSAGAFDLGEAIQDYANACRERLISLHNYLVTSSKYQNTSLYNSRIRAMFSQELLNLGARIGYQSEEPKNS